MTTASQTHQTAIQAPETPAVDFKLEVVVLPVSDIDRAKQFYKQLGWREDADFDLRADLRAVQMTPPGSPASIIFGKGITTQAEPAQTLVLAVDDIEAAHADLVARGIDVSEVYHGNPFDLADPRESGPDPERRSYYSLARFSDPDGNGWLVQEIKTRLPGR